jgi:3-isopropylmalate dehydratase small subunit
LTAAAARANASTARCAAPTPTAAWCDTGIRCHADRRQLQDKPGAQVSVDLAAQTVTDVEGKAHKFEIHEVRKRCLLEGLDDIARTQQYSERIAGFEKGYYKDRPWLTASA